jgi:DNA-binding LacI/PurR family transcriptional regulator
MSVDFEISHLPKNLQKAIHAIAKQIKTGAVKAETNLPSVRVFSEILQFNRQTTWLALKELENQKWLTAQKNGRYRLSDSVQQLVFKSMSVTMVTNGSAYIRFPRHQELFFRLQQQLKAIDIELQLEVYNSLNDNIDYQKLEEKDLILLTGDVSEVFERIKNSPCKIMGLNVDYAMKCSHIINPDSFKSGQEAARHANKSTVKKAAIVSFSRDNNKPWIHKELRYEGFKHIWMERGNLLQDLTRIEVLESKNYLNDANHLHKEISKHSDAELFFCLDERSSIIVTNSLDNLGKKVPHDTQVIGYDVTEISRFSNLSISGFEQNFVEMANQTIHVIQNDLEKEVFDKIHVDLVHRETTQNKR